MLCVVGDTVYTLGAAFGIGAAFGTDLAWRYNLGHEGNSRFGEGSEPGVQDVDTSVAVATHGGELYLATNTDRVNLLNGVIRTYSRVQARHLR